MKRRGTISLVFMVVLLAVLVVISLFGLPLGIREIKPLSTQIQENKLGPDFKGGFFALYEASDEGVENFDAKLEDTMGVIRTRLKSIGMAEAKVSRQGNNKIRIEIPANENFLSSISQYLSTPAKLEWRDPDGKVIATGDNVESASVVMGNETYSVSYKLDSEATKAFSEATNRLMNQDISIYIDDQEVTSYTVTSVESDGEGTIDGGYTYDAAFELALQIDSGALSVNMISTEVRSIGAVLGSDAISTSALAVGIGMAIIMLSMVFIYRVMGLMADIALAYYSIIVLFCVLTLPGVQLTLPGMAGLILATVMAVDANVIIFGRIREELYSGKSPSNAIENGFKSAFTTILDSSIVVLIVVFVLMFLGSDEIKDFAYSLGAGIAVSAITAFIITRFLLRQLSRIGLERTSLFVRPPKASDTSKLGGNA